MENSNNSTHIVDLDAKPRVPNEGYKIEGHNNGGQFLWNPKKVALWFDYANMGGKPIMGHDMLDMLYGRPVFNGCLLDYLLENQYVIPDEWKIENIRIYFWGTIYLDRSGNKVVRYLRFNRNEWRDEAMWLAFHCIKSDAVIAKDY